MRPALAAAIALIVAMLAAVAPARALDLENLTDLERNRLRTEIRDYLLEHPEVIMEAVAVLEQRQAEQQAAEASEVVRANADALFEDDQSWVGGNPEGDVTLVEFMDYRCGFCRRAMDDVNKLVEDDGNIRFVLKEFPILGADSTRAARFAIATLQVAGDDAYKLIHDTLMSYEGSYEDAALARLAGMLGIDAQPILDHMDSDEVSEVIADNHRLAQRLQIRGTPTFVVEDQLLRGFVPLEEMQRIVSGIRDDA